jgi:hypothetical protein
LTSPTNLEGLGPIPPSLASLFERDPLSLTVVELNAIAHTLREGRAEFRQAEIETRAAGKSRVKVPKGKVDIASLLDDI